MAGRDDRASDGRDGRPEDSAARDALLRRLRAAGQSKDAIQRARDEGRLATLAVESSLGGSPTHTLTHVAREAKIDPGFLRELLQANGRPNPRPRERPFTDEDIELARLAREFLDAGLPREALLEIARVLGQGISQVADTVRRVAGNVLLEPGDSELTVALRYAQAADELTPLMGELLAYDFRAYLREGVRRQLVTEAERQAGRLEDSREIAVAFADLVDYTRLGEKLDAEELGTIASRLASLATSATESPTRLVKTIGDAAMFVSPEVPPLIATITALRASIEKEGEDFPALRVGVAYGPATPRNGDWFGATVNVASRATDAARPGRVLATEAVRERAGDRYDWKRKRRRGLKGVESKPRLFSLVVDDS